MIMLEVFPDSFCIHRQLHPGEQIFALVIRLVPEREDPCTLPGSGKSSPLSIRKQASSSRRTR